MMTVRISSGMMGAISRAIGDGLFNTTMIVLVRGSGPGLSQLSRAKVNGMERLDGPHGKKDVRPRDSQGILAKLADSNLAKTIRAGTAVAMLYGATPATEAEAAPKQRPVAAPTLKAKPGKAPESAKKASPAEQMRVRRQRTEREAAPRAGSTQRIAAPQKEAEKEFAQILH